MGRHRHAVNVRVDGLANVLGPLLDDPGVRAAALIDLNSGMVLDACPASATSPGSVDQLGELEELGARQAEVARAALGLLGAPEGVLVLGPAAGPVAGGERHHLLRIVPDPPRDQLVLCVLVDGPRRVVNRALRRLCRVPVEALTAGPTTALRPQRGVWSLAHRALAPRPDALRGATTPAHPTGQGPPPGWGP